MRSATVSAAIVILFWWMATGLLFALQGGQAPHTVAQVISAGFAALGAFLVLHYRHEATARSAQLGFLGGALLWTWVQAGLYGGWLVGPDVLPAALATNRVAFIGEAVRATLYNDLVGIAVLVATAAAARGARNKTAFYTVLFLFVALQTAKLNVFLGAVNQGADLLPPHLVFLSYYFGPPENNPLLPFTALFFAAVAWLLLRSVPRQADPHAGQVRTLLGTLAVLAAVEIALLGIPLRLPFWSGFKPVA